MISDFERASVARAHDELGRPPTEEEIAKSLGLKKKKLNIIKKAILIYNSAPQTDQPETDWTLDEMLMDGHTKAPDAGLADSDNLLQVLNLLSKMDEREATVLRMRFGLDDDEPKTLKEIGECLGLTRERVRQIESEALGRLRETLPAD
jgi:RNA polymerase primary sigma factor